jgi:uncharacterized membrane protein YGL010W
MTFAQKLIVWSPLHRNGVCRTVHFAAGFMFVFAISVPLGWLRLQLGGTTISAAMILGLAIAVYAVLIDRLAGFMMAVLLAPTLWIAEAVSSLPMATGGAIAFGTMAVRFALVIGVHVAIEKRKHGLELGGPVLFLIEPVYLLTLFLFSLGMKKELLADLQAGDPEFRIKGT